MEFELREYRLTSVVDTVSAQYVSEHGRLGRRVFLFSFCIVRLGPQGSPAPRFKELPCPISATPVAPPIFL